MNPEELAAVRQQCGYTAVDIERERDDARAEVERLSAALARVEEIHRPITTTVYSRTHYDAEHDTEDARCSDDCFEPWAHCNGDGTAWPCSTAKAARLSLPTEGATDE